MRWNLSQAVQQDRGIDMSVCCQPARVGRELGQNVESPCKPWKDIVLIPKDKKKHWNILKRVCVCVCVCVCELSIKLIHAFLFS